MRLATLGIAAALLLAALLGYLLFFDRSPVHVAALVPEEAIFAVAFPSLNELRSTYEGGYGPPNREFDAARDLVGRRINVPELDGLDFGRPVVSYTLGSGAEVILVPVRDFAACRRAFETNREAVRLRAPKRIGDYLSFSASAESAARGPDDRRILRALDYPVGIVLSTREPEKAQLFLDVTLAGKPRRPGAGFAARFLAEEGDSWVAGVRPLRGGDEAAVVEVTVEPRADGLLPRSARAAKGCDPAALARAFPARSLLFLAAALGEGDAKKLGLPAPLDAEGALAFAVVGPQRPCDLLLALKPGDPAKLRALDASGPSLLWPDAATPIPFSAMEDGGTVVRTAPLPSLPEAFRGLLDPDARAPAPLFLSTAVEGGTWFLAAGPNAETTLRTALACRRGGQESVGLGANLPVSRHSGFFSPGRSALGMVSQAGLRAFGLSFPVLELGGIGPFSTLTFTLDVAAPGRLEMRLRH
jgi:hypothetical protein